MVNVKLKSVITPTTPAPSPTPLRQYLHYVRKLFRTAILSKNNNFTCKTFIYTEPNRNITLGFYFNTCICRIHSKNAIYVVTHVLLRRGKTWCWLDLNHGTSQFSGFFCWLYSLYLYLLLLIPSSLKRFRQNAKQSTLLKNNTLNIVLTTGVIVPRTFNPFHIYFSPQIFAGCIGIS